MPDTFDTYKTSPTSIPPLTRAVIAAMPVTQFGATVDPVFSDKALRSVLDALASLETRVTTLGG